MIDFNAIGNALFSASVDCKQGKPIKATDEVVDWLDDLMTNGKWETICEFLKRLKPEDFPRVYCSGILVVVAHAKDEATQMARKEFLSRFEAVHGVWRR